MLVCEQEVRERRRAVCVKVVMREVDTWVWGVEKARIWPKNGWAHA